MTSQRAPFSSLPSYLFLFICLPLMPWTCKFPRWAEQLLTIEEWKDQEKRDYKWLEDRHCVCVAHTVPSETRLGDSMRTYLENTVEQMSYKDSWIVVTLPAPKYVLPILSGVKPPKRTQTRYFITLNLIQLQTLQETDIISLKNKK